MASVVAQKVYLDTWPKLLIPPIMELEGVLKYDGGTYEALVLAESPDVYVACGLQASLPTATFEEIDMAFRTLRKFVKASAYCTTNASEELINELSDREKDRLQRGIDSVEKDGFQVRLPFPLTMTTNDIKVMKMKLDMQDDDAHQECDVFALFLKAVSVIHECDTCLDQGLMECRCTIYDPEDVIPSEIIVS